MMNERIRKLAEQATHTAMWIGDPDAGELDAEKFAELIVRECVRVGGQAFLRDNSIVPTFPTNQIFEHFGVAE
jgi:hypothetical protein